MRTYGSLKPGDTLRGVVVRAVEPCGSVVDIQFYDGAPDAWHTFSADQATR